MGIDHFAFVLGEAGSELLAGEHFRGLELDSFLCAHAKPRLPPVLRRTTRRRRSPPPGPTGPREPASRHPPRLPHHPHRLQREHRLGPPTNQNTKRKPTSRLTRYGPGVSDVEVSLSWAEYQSGGSPRGNNPADVVLNVVNGVKVGVEPMTAMIKNALPFATVSFTVCFIICLGVFSQGGKLYGAIGVGLAVGVAASVGVATTTVEKRSCASVSLAAGPLITVTGDVTKTLPEDKINHKDARLKSAGSGGVDVGGALPKMNVGALAGVYVLRYLGLNCV